MSFSASTADPIRLHDTAAPGNGHETKLLERTILGSGKARRVRVVIEDDEVVVSLRIKAARRAEAIPEAYHLVRVAARVASCPLLGEVRHADAFRWPPPVGGA